VERDGDRHPRNPSFEEAQPSAPNRPQNPSHPLSNSPQEKSPNRRLPFSTNPEAKNGIVANETIPSAMLRSSVPYTSAPAPCKISLSVYKTGISAVHASSTGSRKRVDKDGYRIARAELKTLRYSWSESWGKKTMSLPSLARFWALRTLRECLA
jgi:hypothetical protein